MKVSLISTLRSRLQRKFIVAVAFCSGLGFSTHAMAQISTELCGDLRNHYGPFDYRRPPEGSLALVESAHFTRNVEALTSPNTTTYREMAKDVAYTLHVFPNHARALRTMVRLGERHNSPRPPGAAYSVFCYFDRAVRFSPDDSTVRMLFAQFLFKQNKKDEALKQLDAGVEVAGSSGLAHYNLGLVYFQLGSFDRALDQAHKAQGLGFEWGNLEEMLKKGGHWKEPPIK